MSKLNLSGFKTIPSLSLTKMKKELLFDLEYLFTSSKNAVKQPLNPLCSRIKKYHTDFSQRTHLLNSESFTLVFSTDSVQ